MNQKKALKQTYAKIYMMTGLLHVLFLVIFLIDGLWAAVVLNGISILVYLCLSLITSRVKRLGNMFLICYAEIVYFSVGSTLLLGWNSGFMLYFIGMLPLLYYSVYLFKDMDYRYIVRKIFEILVIFYLVMAFSFVGEIRHYQISVNLEQLLYTINISVALMMIIGFMGVFVNKMMKVTKTLAEENSVLETDANFDPLTRLLNRRSFSNIMGRCIRLAEEEGRYFCVLMCDLDDFKGVNDYYGHDCGDEVLLNTAKILKSAVRDRDYVFRWGGEEFLIILNGEVEFAPQVAERCRKMLESSSVIWNGKVVRETITIGGCKYSPGMTEEKMISKADQNLYYGKRSGKNIVIF